MTSIGDATVLVVDTGWYSGVASRLAQEFDQVLYWAPWEKDFPDSQDAKVGGGLEGVTRMKYLWEAVPLADLVVVPDKFDDLVEHLRGMGKLVWGSGRGSELERDRRGLKDYLTQHGLPVIDHEIVVGLTELRLALEDPQFDGWFLKLANGYRGDMETHHHLDWERSRDWFYRLAGRVGPVGDSIVFMLEPPMEGFEGGGDTFSIDGEMPAEVMIGYEIKDRCYVSTTKMYANLSSPIREGFDALTDWFRNTGYRNFFSTEVRVVEGTAYLIDLAARFGWPPTATLLTNIANIGEIMYYGAQGIMVQPKFIKRYGVELGITSPFLTAGWLTLMVPPEVQPYVYFHGAIKRGDAYWLRPQSWVGEHGAVGSVAAIDNDLQVAIKKCIERAKAIEGEGIEFDTGAIKSAEKFIKKGEASGIKF